MPLTTLPLLKLGLLGVRQFARPIIESIRDEAKNSKIFRKYICMPPAQLYHFIEVRIKMAMLKLGRPAHVLPLNEAAAIDLGAEILGELIVFLVAATAIIVEAARQKRKERYKTDQFLFISGHRENARNALDVLQYRVAKNNAHLVAAKHAFKELGKPIEIQSHEEDEHILEQRRNILSKFKNAKFDVDL